MMMTIMTISAEKASSRGSKTTLTFQPCSRLHHERLHHGSASLAMTWMRVQRHAAVRRLQHLRLAITCWRANRRRASVMSSPFGMRAPKALLRKMRLTTNLKLYRYRVSRGMTTVQMIRAQRMLLVLSEGLQEDIRYPIDSGLFEVLGSYYRDTTFGIFTIFSQGSLFPSISFVCLRLQQTCQQNLLDHLYSWLIWWNGVSELCL